MTSPKLRSKILDDPLYGTQFHIFVGSHDQVFKQLSKAPEHSFYGQAAKEMGQKSGNEGGYYTTCTDSLGNKYRLIGIDPKMVKGWGDTVESLIAHECFHATMDTLYDRGLEWSTKSDEAFTYYLQWLYSHVYKVVLSYGKR